MNWKFHRLGFIFLAALLFLSGCALPFSSETGEAEGRSVPAFSEYTVAPNFIPRTVILTALGDSLTQGVGDEEESGGYVGRLAEEMDRWTGVRGVIIENTAKRGRRSDQLLAMFREGELTGPLAEADYIVLTIGGNDLMRIVKRDLFNLTVEAFEEEQQLFETRFRNILAQTRSINEHAPLIVLGVYNPFLLITEDVPEFDEIVASYNASLEAAAEEDPQGCFVPVDDLFRGKDHLVYHTDFFHPNARGYELMAERVTERMEECGFVFEQGETT